jgi:hypothetical protein
MESLQWEYEAGVDISREEEERPQLEAVTEQRDWAQLSQSGIESEVREWKV